MNPRDASPGTRFCTPRGEGNLGLRPTAGDERRCQRTAGVRAGAPAPAAGTAALLLLLLAPIAIASPIVVILPVSSDPSAAIEQGFADELSARGWTVAPMQEVEIFLEEHRIRYLDSLPRDTSDALCERFGARAILVGSLLAYRDDSNATVAVSARMLDAKGTLLWGDVAASSAAETEGMLGLGRRESADELSRVVVHELLQRAPGPDAAGRVTLHKGTFARGPVTYRSASHEPGKMRRICVLPFASTTPDASRIVLEILTVRLEATGEFDVVEPAELRAAMRAEKLRSIAELTSAELARLAKHLGTTAFLRGNVHAFREAPAGRSEVHMDMTLADVDTGEILWAVTHQRSGAEYAGLLQRGLVHNVVALADRVVSEAIAAQHRARPRTPGRKSNTLNASRER